MNSKPVIILAVQFMLACAPLSRQASALERDRNPVQQCRLYPEQSQDCLNPRDTSRVKDNRQAMLRHRRHIQAMPPPSDLLQELLPPSDISYESNQMQEEIKILPGICYKNTKQETGLLEELLVTTSIP
jgi:hypothetical protein